VTDEISAMGYAIFNETLHTLSHDVSKPETLKNFSYNNYSSKTNEVNWTEYNNNSNDKGQTNFLTNGGYWTRKDSILSE
jgi:hypothetical protein